MSDEPIGPTARGPASTAADMVTTPEHCRMNWERWTKWSVRLSALLLAVVVTCNAWSAYSQSQARVLRCDQPVFTFGRAFFGDVIEHTFHVANAGRSTIEITGVRTDCGCTTVTNELQGRVLAPGQSVDVPVKLSLTRNAIREVDRKIMLQLAGEPARRVTLRLKGEVDSRWEVSPAVVNFDTVRPNETSRRIVRLMLRSGASPVKITHVSTTTPMFDAAVKTDADSNGSPLNEVTITMVPPLPKGSQRGELYIYTSDSSVPTGPVPITAYVAE